MTNKEYGEHDGISKSQLYKITQSPLHFKYALDNPTEDTPALLFGRAVHKYILEKEDFEKEFCVMKDFACNTKDGKQSYIDYVENVLGRPLLDEEKKYKDTITRALLSSGKELITETDFETIKAMAEVVECNKIAKRLLTGEHEMSFFWTDEQTQELCKCRPDCLATIGDNHIIVDYKTTDNAEQEAFMKSAIKYGYDLQAGMYTEGMKANTGNDYSFIFVAQEKKPPYAINILQADEYFMKEGNNLFHDLLGIYHDCKLTDNWYGYEGADGEIANMSLPKWLLKEFQ